MIPFGYHTVTLVHKDKTGYTRTFLNGCSWKSTVERTLTDGATVLTERTTCRVPPGYRKPEPGDVMILGKVTDIRVQNEIDLVRLLDDMRAYGYRLFRVEACADLSAGTPLPHYAATGA